MRSRHGPTRREFLGGVAGGLATAGLARAAPVRAERPDVLLLVIEDASAERFGCYGQRVCRTPAVDAFAASALTFDRAHTHPLCGPSRTAMLLGKRPSTTGVVGNAQDWRRTVPDAVTLPAHFRAHGYHAVRIGRIFFGHGGDWQDGEHSWDAAVTCGAGLPEAATPKRAARAPASFVEGLAAEADDDDEEGTRPFLYGPSGLADAEEHDGILASAAVRALELRESSGKPLFLAVGFARAHLPFMAPDAWFERYPAERMPLPEGVDPDRARRPGDPVGAREWREAIAAQFACLSFVDAQVGRVLAALEASGRADRTIVVVASDHGFMLGEHGRFRKGQLLDIATRPAFLLRAPGWTRPGSRSPRPVELVDLFPTLAELAGLPVPGDLEGLSLGPLVEEPNRVAWKRGALMETRGGRSIVTERWRYTEYTRAGRGPHLFDHWKDPGERLNRAKRDGLAPVVTELRRLLHGGWRASLPVAPPPAVLREEAGAAIRPT